MNQEYKDALAEIDIILNYVEQDSINKIPEDIIKFIKDNKSNHTIEINPFKSLEDQNLLNDTKIILAKIYIDYWCTKEEKDKLLKEEREEWNRIELQKKEKYPYENLFKNNIKEELVNEEKSISVVEEKWLTKFIIKLKKFLKIGY